MSVKGSCRPIGAKEQKKSLPMFACARGQAEAFLRQPGGGEENVYMMAAMSYYFFQRNGDLIALPVYAPQHGDKVFPVLSSCCSSLLLGALVDFH